MYSCKSKTFIPVKSPLVTSVSSISSAHLDSRCREVWVGPLSSGSIRSTLCPCPRMGQCYWYSSLTLDSRIDKHSRVLFKFQQQVGEMS